VADDGHIPNLPRLVSHPRGDVNRTCPAPRRCLYGAACGRPSEMAGRPA
jgi:hypothetical protein